MPVDHDYTETNKKKDFHTARPLSLQKKPPLYVFRYVIFNGCHFKGIFM
jgi:hypothetical protein